MKVSILRRDHGPYGVVTWFNVDREHYGVVFSKDGTSSWVDKDGDPIHPASLYGHKLSREIQREMLGLIALAEGDEHHAANVSKQPTLMDFFFGTDPNRDKPPGGGGGFMGIPRSLMRGRRRR